MNTNPTNPKKGEHKKSHPWRKTQEIERLKAIIVEDTDYRIKYAKAQEEIERLRGRKECKCNE